MRIALSNTHNSGKTTLLKALKENELFSDYQFIDGPTRKAAALGIPINEQGEDATQLFCLSYDLEMLLTKSGNIISDRCLFDTYIYTLYLFYHNKVQESTLTAIKLLWEQQKLNYDLILMPSHFEVPLEEDGERSINFEFRDSIYRLFLAEANDNIGIIPMYTIGGTVEQRVETIVKLLGKDKI